MPVEFFQPAMARVVEHARPEQLGLADDHGLGMLRDLVGAQRGVKTAHHDRHAAPPVFGRDLVGALGGVGLDADGDEIGGRVERDRLHAIVVEAELDVFWREAGERRGGQRLHLPGADVGAVAAMAADARMDECDFHRTAASDSGAASTLAARGGARPMIQSQL